MLKRVTLSLALLFSSSGVLAEDLYKKYDSEWTQLSKFQKNTAQMIYDYAVRDDLGWTAVAIAWQESQLGRWQINMNSKTSWDCGMFQNNTKSVAGHQDVPHNQFNRKEICTRLITNYNFAYLNFAKEIEYWRGVHKDNWRKVWSSYNGGWKGNKEYAMSIVTRIQVLKNYIKE